MSYKEEVRDKIQGSAERTEERIKLWEEVHAALDHGGVEQVSSMLAERVESLKCEFEEAIRKLQEML
ncbi:MAG: hypothetical protein GH152_00150 [Dehalococcoidia bacterium]|nr:hypothetical protein [Dehalococcoidia bacterium]